MSDSSYNCKKKMVNTIVGNLKAVELAGLTVLAMINETLIGFYFGISDSGSKIFWEVWNFKWTSI